MCYYVKHRMRVRGGEAGWSAFFMPFGIYCTVSVIHFCRSVFSHNLHPLHLPLNCLKGFGLWSLLAIWQTLSRVGGFLAIYVLSCLWEMPMFAKWSNCRLFFPDGKYCTSSQCSAVTAFFLLAATPCLSINPETPSHFVTCTNLSFLQVSVTCSGKCCCFRHSWRHIIGASALSSLLVVKGYERSHWVICESPTLKSSMWEIVPRWSENETQLKKRVFPPWPQ